MPRLSYRRREIDRAYRKPTLDFSITGLIYTSMMLFMGLAAINSQANLLFGVFGLMIGVLLVSAFISRIVLKKLDVRRIFPDYLVAGQPAALQYEFHNRKRYWPSLSVTLGELGSSDAFTKQPQVYLLHAAAGTRAIVPMQVIPKSRGLYQFDRYQLSTSFPFGFIKRALDRQREETLLVYPPIAEVDSRLLSLCISAEKSGARMKPRRGGADEFYGVKEYRAGENPRWIYSRRSARTGTLVAKEMTQVAPPRILILMDTHILPGPNDDRSDVERTIAQAASLISRAIEQGLAVGLYAWSAGWVHIPPSRGKRHCHELLTVLARLPLNTAQDRRSLLETGRKLVESGTTPILFTPRDLEQNLADQARGHWLVIPATSDQASKWFHFPASVDFKDCVPPEQGTLQK